MSIGLSLIIWRWFFSISLNLWPGGWEWEVYRAGGDLRVYLGPLELAWNNGM